MRMFGITDPALRKLGEALGRALGKPEPARNPYPDPRDVLVLPKWKPHLCKSRGLWRIRTPHQDEDPAPGDGFGWQVCEMRLAAAIKWRNWMNDPRGRTRPPHYTNRRSKP